MSAPSATTARVSGKRKARSPPINVDEDTTVALPKLRRARTMAALPIEDVQDTAGVSEAQAGPISADSVAVQATPSDQSRALVPARGIGSGQVVGGQRVPVFPLEPRTEITRRRWITDDVIARIERECLDRSDRRNATFSLSQVPTEIAWGPKTVAPDYSGYMCLWTVPATVQATGYITRLQFAAETREPVPRVTVTLELLRELDQVGLERCMDRAGIVVGPSRHTFEATRTGYGVTDLKPFRDVYDATAVLAPVECMPRMCCSELVVGDLVLVQAKLRRMNSIAGWSVGGGAIVNVWFELEHVCLIHRRLGSAA
ncbi:hypothetical protein C8Q76DRAFT_798999 [Earliella scabrosa]|nr:hypothetical protein C8Q76DRAFT_798999 [Earliella scabrosa]